MTTVEIQRRLAEGFIQGYNTFDVDDVLNLRAETCVHHSLVPSRAQPPRSNEEYTAFVEKVKEHMSDIKVSAFLIPST